MASVMRAMGVGRSSGPGGDLGYQSPDEGGLSLTRTTSRLVPPGSSLTAGSPTGILLK